MLIGRVISSNMFSYCAENNTFSAELSTIAGNGYNVFGALYTDSCDQGFVMQSARTGVKVPFYLHKGLSEHGELYGWEFLAIHTQGLKVTIFND